MTDRRIIKTIWRHDRKRSVSITEKLGLYSLTEEGNQEDRFECEGRECVEIFWGPISSGGFYDTAENAERAALAELPWLGEFPN